MNLLGKISVMGFSPQTAKRGHEITERKQKLRDEFEIQNKNELPQMIKDCKTKESLNLMLFLS